MEPIIISTIAIAAFALTDGMSDAWLFRDFATRQVTANTKWHRWQAARQGLFITFCAWYCGQWAFLLLGAAAFWLVHDGVVNLVGLQRPFFYVGTTAAIDRFFQSLPFPELAMAAAKVVALAAGLYLTFQ
jgi:hypothetical protein